MRCPECGSEKISHNHEGIICDSCGLVIKKSYYSGKRMLV